MNVLPILLAVAMAAPQSATYVPAQTKVALLPTVNTSSEKWQELKDQQCQRGDGTLRTLFESYGFHVLSAAAVKTYLDKESIDLTDEENWNRRTLADIGKGLGVRLIAFAPVIDTLQKKDEKLFVTSQVGIAKLRVWLLDTETGTAHLTGKPLEGKSQNDFGGKGSDRQIRAVDLALEAALKEFFKPYKKVKTAAR